MFNIILIVATLLISSDTIFLNLPELDHGGKGT